MKKVEAFRMFLKTLAEEEGVDFNSPDHYFLARPRMLFISACLELNELDKKDYFLLVPHFLKFLEENKIEISQRDKRFFNFFKEHYKKVRAIKRARKRDVTPFIVSPLMMDGARKADFQHHKVLGDDY